MQVRTYHHANADAKELLMNPKAERREHKAKTFLQCATLEQMLKWIVVKCSQLTSSAHRGDP